MILERICFNCQIHFDFGNNIGGHCDICDRNFCDECIDYKNCLLPQKYYDVICFSCSKTEFKKL